MPRAKRGSSTDSATPEPLNADTTEPTSDAVAPPTATAAPEAPKRRTARRTVKVVEEAIPADPGTGHLAAQPEAGPPAETAGAEAVKPKSRRPRGKTTENLVAVFEPVTVTPEEPPAVPKRRRGTKAEATVLAGGAIVEFEAPEPVETDSTRTAQAAKAPISIPSVETEADTASHRIVVIGGREVEIITSLDNDKVRYVRSLHEKRSRDAENAFIIEGVRLVEEALGAGAEVSLVLFDPEAVSRNSRARQVIEACREAAYPVTDRVLRSVADTATPQGIVGVARVPEPAESFPGGRLVLVLDAVQDPGNLGSILRAAVASGVGAVVLAPDCADAYSPKVVRSGMGAHFHLDLFPSRDWDQISRVAARRQVLVGVPAGGRPYHQVDWNRPTVLVISNEGSGPSLGALRLAGEQGTGKVSIPMLGPADSLNAAVAAGILLFEAARQANERKYQGDRQSQVQRGPQSRNSPFREGGPQRGRNWQPQFDRGNERSDRGGDRGPSRPAPRRFDRDIGSGGSYDGGGRQGTERGNSPRPPYDRGGDPNRGPRGPYRGGPNRGGGGSGGPHRGGPPRRGGSPYGGSGNRP